MKPAKAKRLAALIVLKIVVAMQVTVAGTAPVVCVKKKNGIAGARGPFWELYLNYHVTIP